MLNCSQQLSPKRLARWLKSTWSSPMMRRLAVVILWPLRDYMKSKEGVCRWQRVWFLPRKDTNSYHFLLHKFLAAARDFACKHTQTSRTSSLVLWRRQERGEPQGQCCLRSSLALSSLGWKVRKASPILKVKVGRKAAQKDLHLYGKTCFLGTRAVQDAWHAENTVIDWHGRFFSNNWVILGCDGGPALCHDCNIAT